MLFKASILLFGLFGSSVLAAPAPALTDDKTDLEKRGLTVLSSTQRSSFDRYTQFARAAYCNNGASTWKCGAACQANSDFVIYAGGGDGGAVPAWFVGWSPTLYSVIVAHEGTDPTNFLSLLNDAQLLQVPMDQKFFPGVPGNLRVHEGFHSTFKRTATTILANVKKVMAARNSNTVTVVGHSLGGAIASLELLYLSIQMPTAKVKMVGYGVPRVGCQEYADYMDKFDITRINNHQDPIPILPGRGLGYAHSQMEVHIDGSNTWRFCSGHDNPDRYCSTGNVPNIFLGNILSHLGPYNGIGISSLSC